MKITFILPGVIKIPIGGVKIIYRYAKEFANYGHKVVIISLSRNGLKENIITFTREKHYADIVKVRCNFIHSSKIHFVNKEKV